MFFFAACRLKQMGNLNPIDEAAAIAATMEWFARLEPLNALVVIGGVISLAGVAIGPRKPGM